MVGPGHRRISVLYWLKESLMRRIAARELLSVDSLLLVRLKGDRVVAMTSAWRQKRDLVLPSIIGWDPLL